jgi:hypothetical protein
MLKLGQTEKSNKWLHYGCLALVGVVLLGTVLGAGFYVGRRSARSNATPVGRRITLPGGHGAVGKIQLIEGTTITLQTRDGAMQIILTDNQTRIERGLTKTTKLTLRDLKIGDQIIVVGTSNAQGQITAKLIRVLATSALTPTPTGL